MNKTVYKRADHSTGRFTQIANEAIKDERLNDGQVGLLVRILSNSDSFVVYKSQFRKRSRYGRSQFDKNWSSLVEHGYIIESVEVTPKGKIYTYTIVEKPMRKPTVENPTVGKHTANNTNRNNTKKDINVASAEPQPFTGTLEEEDSMGKSDQKSTTSHEVEEIYKAYPSKCPVTSKRTAKGSKNKRQIEGLLKSHSKEELLKIIALYTLEVKREGFKQMKNFSTFLNNLPDYSEELDNMEEVAGTIDEIVSLSEFAEGEEITIKKLKQLYNDNDLLAVWAVQIGEFAGVGYQDAGETFISSSSVSTISLMIERGVYKYKFIHEIRVNGQLKKQFTKNHLSSVKFDEHHKAVRELSEVIQKKYGCSLCFKHQNTLKWLLYTKRADSEIILDMLDVLKPILTHNEVLDADSFDETLELYGEILSRPNKLDDMIKQKEEQKQDSQLQKRSPGTVLAQMRLKKAIVKQS